MAYFEDIFSLRGEVAVVTGGGGSLPRAMAYALVKAGARVSLWGRGKNTPVEPAVKDMREKTGLLDAVSGITVDTGCEKEVFESFLQTEKELGMPSILINGVGGTGQTTEFIETDIKIYEKTLYNNLIAGCIIPSKVFSKLWIKKKINGSIINIASMTSYIPLPGVWAYDAAKAGIKNMTMALASELAPHNIRVNAIAPGFFIGKQNRDLLINKDNPNEFTQRGKKIIARIPFDRFGETGELAGITLLLASNKASGYMTGVCIPVDGGYLSRSI